MIKSLHKNDTLTSPYIATKDWQLSNTDDSNLLLMEHSSSTICLETLEYNQSQSVTGSVCSICTEQQENDLVNFREGEKSSGIFYPDLEEINLDGTYKRLVYSQVKEMFYNNYRDPTKMWGMENIDFDKSQTKKFIADLFRLYDIPRDVFGEKILENTVQVVDTTTDNNYLISDDGHGNLFAGPNLFAKQQEVGQFDNYFLTGSNTSCNPYFGLATPIDAPPVSGYKVWLLPLAGNILSASVPVTTDHQLVTTWLDQSGYNNHAYTHSLNTFIPQYSASSMNGLDSVLFGYNGVGKTGLLSQTMSINTTGLSVFVVTRAFMVGDQYDTVFAYDTTEFLLRRDNQLQKMQVYHNSSGTSIDTTNTFTNGQNYVFSTRFSDTANTLRIYINTSVEGTVADTGTISSGKKYTVGYRFDDGIFSFWHGHVAEVVVYDSPLSDSEMTSVQSWLMNKYGIT